MKQIKSKNSGSRGRQSPYSITHRGGQRLNPESLTRRASDVGTQSNQTQNRHSHTGTQHCVQRPAALPQTSCCLSLICTCPQQPSVGRNWQGIPSQNSSSGYSLAQTSVQTRTRSSAVGRKGAYQCEECRRIKKGGSIEGGPVRILSQYL